MGKKTFGKILGIGAIVLGAVLPGAGFLISAVGKVGAAIVGGVVAAGLSAVGSKLVASASAKGGAGNAKESGIMVSVQDNVATIPIVYGRRRLAGRQVYVTTSGQDNKYLHLVFAIAEGEIQEIERIIFGDNEIAFDGSVTPMTASSGSLAASQARGRFTNRVSVDWRLGTTTQTAFSDLVTATTGQDGNWTSEHRGLGVAMVHLKFEYDKDKFAQIPQVYFDIKGKKVRTTFGANWSSPVTAWSENPAAIALDYLTNSTYGKGLSLDDIEQASYEDTYDYCDELIDLYTEGGSPVQGKRYVANGFLDPDTPVFDNIKGVLTPFNGFLVWSAGKYKIKVLKDETILLDVNGEEFTFDESNIIGDISMQMGSKENMANRVKARFYNAGLNYAEDVAIWEDDDLRVRNDNGEWLELELSLPFCSDYTRAQMLAKQFLEQSRRGTIVSFEATPDALQAEIGNRVWFSHPYLGFQDDYRVMGLVMNPDKTITVTLQQYDDAIYSVDQIAQLPGPLEQNRNTKFDGSDFGEIPPAPTSPQYYRFCPGNVVGSEEGYKITCTAPAFANIAYYSYVITTSTTTKTFTSPTNYLIVPLTAWPGGTLTHVKVRAVSSDGTLGTLSSAASLITNPDSATLCNLTPPGPITHWQICDGADGAVANRTLPVGASPANAGPGSQKYKVRWYHGPSVAQFVSYKIRLVYFAYDPAVLDTASFPYQPIPSPFTLSSVPGVLAVYNDTENTVTKDVGATTSNYQEFTFPQIVTTDSNGYFVNLATRDVPSGLTGTYGANVAVFAQVAGITSSSAEVWQYAETTVTNPVSGTQCLMNAQPPTASIVQICDGTGGNAGQGTLTDELGTTGWFFGGQTGIGVLIEHGPDCANIDKYVIALRAEINGVEKKFFTEEIAVEATPVAGDIQVSTLTNTINLGTEPSGYYTYSLSAVVYGKRTTGNLLTIPTSMLFEANPDVGVTDCG